jgi:hypothetical protein
MYLVPHGYIEIYLDNKWIKPHPLLTKNSVNLNVFEFDGENDSIFQEFDRQKKLLWSTFSDGTLMKYHYLICSNYYNNIILPA